MNYLSACECTIIPAVIIVYINMHGDTYPIISVHIDMPGDNPQEEGKLHIAGIKEIYGYHSVYP